MSNYQIKEQCYSYEAVNAKTHLQASSPEFLSNQELIELALDVSPERSLDLIQDIDSISEINFLIEGLDESNAIQLQAMFELCRRFCLSTISKKESISSSYDLAQRLINEMKNYLQEKFILITLNTKNQIIKQHTLFIGTLNQSVAHPRDIFRQAITDNAAQIIVVHNHPSGNPTPSELDDTFTQRLKETSKIVGIPLLDHFVIGSDSYYPYAE